MAAGDRSYLLQFLTKLLFISTITGVTNADNHDDHDHAHPFDFGDFVALIIIITCCVGGIFACLGSYARSRAMLNST